MLTKTSRYGTLVLTNNETATGGITVNDGTLLVDGSTAAASDVVLNAGTLGGNGTIGGNVDILGGTISAGHSPGLLDRRRLPRRHAAGRGLRSYDPGIGGYDQIAVEGAATLGGAVDVVTLDGFMPAVGTKFDILTAAGGITNSDLAGISFTYGGTMLPATFWVPSIVDLGGGAQALELTVGVPEPSSLVLLLLGLAGLAACGRRPKRSPAPGTEERPVRFSRGGDGTISCEP